MKRKATEFPEERPDGSVRHAECVCGFVSTCDMTIADGGCVVFEGACEGCSRRLHLSIAARPAGKEKL